MKQIQIGGKTYKAFDSIEEAFPESFKSETFVKLYNEEAARLALVHQIKTMRHQRKWTQKALAKRTKMTQSVIARVESGKHSFSLGTLYGIAKAFNKHIMLV